MYCGNEGTIRRPFEAEVREVTPGFTLAEATGQKRIRMLEDCRKNLLAIISEKEDEILIIDHELAKLRLPGGDLR